MSSAFEKGHDRTRARASASRGGHRGPRLSEQTSRSDEAGRSQTTLLFGYRNAHGILIGRPRQILSGSERMLCLPTLKHGRDVRHDANLALRDVDAPQTQPIRTSVN